MRYPRLAIVLILVFASSVSGTFDPIRRQTNANLKEESVYWDRFMTETSSLSFSKAPSISPSVPTPSPTPMLPLTPPPLTPPPIPFPTLSPVTLPPTPPPTPTPTPVPSPTPPPVTTPTPPPVPSPTVPPPTPPPTPPPLTPPPIPFPTLSPVTLPPTPPPTPPAVPSPTPPPVTVPTPPPVPSPTVPPPTPPPTPPSTPSPVPPTSFPTLPSTPSLACAIELNIECRDANGTSCDEIILPPVICTQNTEVLTMMYNGGDCGQSFNTQPSPLFECFDLQPPGGAGPPPLEGPVYIEARSSVNGTLKFAGVIDVLDTYNLTNVDADTSILVSEINGTMRGTPMQLINFHTACDQNLFLRDRFGAQQVAGWINEVQGVVNSDVGINYSYNISNTGGVNAELVELNTSYTPPEPPTSEDLTGQIAGQILEPGENVEVQIPVTIDLTTSLLYTILGDVLGTTPNGEDCSDSAITQFYAGTPVPGRPEPPLPSQPAIAPAPAPASGGLRRGMMEDR